MGLFNQVAALAYAAVPEFVPAEKTDKHPFVAAAKPHGGVAEHLVPAVRPVRCWYSMSLSLCGTSENPRAETIAKVTCKECREQIVTLLAHELGGEKIEAYRKPGPRSHKYVPSEGLCELGLNNESPPRGTDYEAACDFLLALYKGLCQALGAAN